MNIIGLDKLKSCWQEKPETETALKSWIQVTNEARWRHLFDLKNTYRYADAVGSCIAFNIRGNHFRLITKINFRTETVTVLYVLTHKQYDEKGKNSWKKTDCDCLE